MTIRDLAEAAKACDINHPLPHRAERFTDLKYWPVLLAHIRKHEERVTEEISDPVFSNDGRIVYNVTLRCMCVYFFFSELVFNL